MRNTYSSFVLLMEHMLQRVKKRAFKMVFSPIPIIRNIFKGLQMHAMSRLGVSKQSNIILLNWLRGFALQIKWKSAITVATAGRLAQWESASFTRKRSWVRYPHRLPYNLNKESSRQYARELFYLLLGIICQ